MLNILTNWSTSRDRNIKIEFQNFRETKNIGDFSCSPFDWFTWGPDASVSDIRKSPQKYDIGILGGGKIFGGLSNYAGVQKSVDSLNIAWGLSTVQSFPISPKYTRDRKLCDLIGTRDWGDKRFDWAPCTSCMAPFFDDAGKPEHDVVFYFHGGKTEKQGIKIPEWIPTLSNNAATLDEALNFIASGKIVVSNSYHGVYWSILMGRKALCIPFSNKFGHYRLPPGFSKPKDWLSNLDRAQAHPELLQMCRSATSKFHEKVLEKISNFKTEKEK